MLSKNDRSVDGMFVFWNPCARANLHQQKRALKLCSATLTLSPGELAIGRNDRLPVISRQEISKSKDLF